MADLTDAQVLLENAEAARATKQTDRAMDYCTQAIDIINKSFPESKRKEIVDTLDGTQEKVEKIIDKGPECEQLLDALVTLSQLLSLRGELEMDRGKSKQASEDLKAACQLCEKLCDDIAAARCMRSQGMLHLMHKEITEAEALLSSAVQKCRDAGDGREEAATLRLLIGLHEGRAAMFDHTCQLYHEGDADAVAGMLLDLGQFRLRRHLADVSAGIEVEYSELEMTDMDLSGSLQSILDSDTAAGPGGGGGGGAGSDEEGDEGGAGKRVRRRLAEALTAVGTVRMLLGDQPGAVEALEKARSRYEAEGDKVGAQRAAGLLGDVRRIMDKVDSTSVTPSAPGAL